MTIPDHWIERVHLGEATPAMEQAVANDADAQAKLTALAQADVEFHTALDAATQVVAIERKLHVAETQAAVDAAERRRGRWRYGLAGLPLLAAALALVVALPASEPDATDAPYASTAKGDKEKILVHKRGRRNKLLDDNDRLGPGAQLQLGYRTENTHAVLLSLDGRGVVTVHRPNGSNTSTPSGQYLLDHAYELDDAPRFERFFLVTADQPLSVAALVEAAEDLAQSDNPAKAELAIPAGAFLDDLTIKKVTP